MPTAPRKPFLPTVADLKWLVRLNGVVLVWSIPVLLVVVLLIAKNVRTSGDRLAAILVHAAMFALGLLMIRWGKRPQ
jgi:hypothetical protein